MTTPSYWTPLPAGFPQAPKVSVLLAEFGAPGPYTLIVLLATATAQGYLGGPKGWVRMAWVEMAHRTATEPAAAEVIVRRIAELGEIEIAADEHGFSARLVGWEKWKPTPKDPTAAERKARERAKATAASPVTDRDTA
jgi:hypothetical protein